MLWLMCSLGYAQPTYYLSFPIVEFHLNLSANMGSPFGEIEGKHNQWGVNPTCAASVEFEGAKIELRGTLKCTAARAPSNPRHFADYTVNVTVNGASVMKLEERRATELKERFGRVDWELAPPGRFQKLEHYHYPAKINIECELRPDRGLSFQKNSAGDQSEFLYFGSPRLPNNVVFRLEKPVTWNRIRDGVVSKEVKQVSNTGPALVDTVNFLQEKLERNAIDFPEVQVWLAPDLDWYQDRTGKLIKKVSNYLFIMTKGHSYAIPLEAIGAVKQGETESTKTVLSISCRDSGEKRIHFGQYFFRTRPARMLVEETKKHDRIAITLYSAEDAEKCRKAIIHLMNSVVNKELF